MFFLHKNRISESLGLFSPGLRRSEPVFLSVYRVTLRDAAELTHSVLRRCVDPTVRGSCPRSPGARLWSAAADGVLPPPPHADMSPLNRFRFLWDLRARARAAAVDWNDRPASTGAALSSAAGRCTPLIGQSPPRTAAVARKSSGSVPIGSVDPVPSLLPPGGESQKRLVLGLKPEIKPGNVTFRW